MRNRGFVIFLTLLLTLISLYFLSFTLVSKSQERKALRAAKQADGTIDNTIKQSYLDSIYNEPVYDFFGLFNFTYREVKEKELSLGLDLQGGMHVILEVSPVEVLKSLAGNTSNANFKEAITIAKERQKSSQSNFVDLFIDAYEEKAGKGKLAEVFVNAANRGSIDFSSTDEDIKVFIREQADNSVERAYEIIRNRVDKFGVTQPNVQRIQGTGRIQVELPGVTNPQRVRKLLQGVAKLEFMEVWTAQDVFPHIMAANEAWVKKQDALKGISTPDTVANGDSASLAQADSTQPKVSEIFSKRVPLQTNGLVYEMQDTASIMKIFRDADIKALLPEDLRFAWSVKPVQGIQNGKAFFELYTLKTDRLGKAVLGGEVVTDARAGIDDMGRQEVSMSMSVEGAKQWQKVTAANIQNQIAIVLDGFVYSAPTVQSEIPGGRSSITGNFTLEEAKDLANILKAGKLPAPTHIVEEAVVGPSLGIAAQNQGISSILIGLSLVVLFMVLYYAKAGWVANGALIVNVFFIFGVLSNLQAALTLPGIAGIVLTIGMSIDANVLIFERIREEMRESGKGLLAAINDGYDRAFITILDANLTTFLTAIFLYVFGLGPIKGFAITLMVGIGTSFFTAVWVTRMIMSFMTSKGEDSKVSFSMPFTEKLFVGTNFQFMAKRKTAYMISGTIILIGMILMFTKGLNMGVDFQGGRSYVVEFNSSVVPSEIKVDVISTLKSAEVKSFDSDNKVKITTNFMVDEETEEADEKVSLALMEGLNKYKELNPRIVSTSKVGATIADDILKSSQFAVLFSLAALFLYIFIRFRKWQFGFGAIVALFHDTLCVLSMFAIANVFGISFEIDQVFVAAMLTIIGYSVNDTVVVFDRVREFLQSNPHHNAEGTLNYSVNTTLNRTMITSLTTLLVVIILFIAGGEVLRGFSFALLVGIFFGTYSSIFIATPIVLDTAKADLESMVIETRKRIDEDEEDNA